MTSNKCKLQKKNQDMWERHNRIHSVAKETNCSTNYPERGRREGLA